MKKRTLCFILLLVFIVTACHSVQIDFWTATLNALDKRIENNTYNEGNWDIGVEDASQTEDEDHRDLTIRYITKNDVYRETTMLSFQHKNNQKTVSYIYETSAIENEKEIVSNVTITSTDETYHSYDVTYTEQSFQSGAYQDGTEMTGHIQIEDHQTITYENVPMLEEALNQSHRMLMKFQEEFELSFDEYEFVNLPKLSEGLEIPRMTQVKTATKDYYSKGEINAKGYMLITYLKINENARSAEFGTYNVERKENESSIDVTLEKRSEQPIYNMIQAGDSDESYVVYIEDETAYVYSQAITDDKLLADIHTGGTNAKYILETVNHNQE